MKCNSYDDHDHCSEECHHNTDDDCVLIHLVLWYQHLHFLTTDTVTCQRYRYHTDVIQPRYEIVLEWTVLLLTTTVALIVACQTTVVPCRFSVPHLYLVVQDESVRVCWFVEHHLDTVRRILLSTL